MEKHIIETLSGTASELRLASASLTDIIARLTKIADELANDVIVEQDAEKARAIDNDRVYVKNVASQIKEDKDDLLGQALNLVLRFRRNG